MELILKQTFFVFIFLYLENIFNTVLGDKDTTFFLFVLASLTTTVITPTYDD